MAAPVLLRRARAAYGGELMLMKGPEVAACYRHPSDRGFHDVDLLADDAPAAQRALIAAGFAQFGNLAAYDDAQHLCPLIWPGMPLIIELHRHPNQPPWLPHVSARAVLEHAVPSATGVDGLLAPAPSAHALLLATHSWCHQPLGRLADLLDVAVVLAGDGRRGAARPRPPMGLGWRLARRPRCRRRHPQRQRPTVVAQRLGAPPARALANARCSRVTLRALPHPPAPCRSGRAPAALAGVVRDTATRREDEPWADKLRRSRLAIAHAFMQQIRPRAAVVPVSQE